MDGGPVRFGVLAPTSMVARLAVIPAIARSPLAELVSVASLSASPGSVDAVPAGTDWLADYDAVLVDSRVEAVYVPLPNSLHREWVERAADAGKHVLCEKPLGVSATDAAAMAEHCERRGVVLMEAYMTPFHPRARAVSDLVAAGRLGEPLFGFAAFTGRLGRPDDHRWRPEMGGGALLDVGIYCLAPLLAWAGVPAELAGDEGYLPSVGGLARSGGEGVDASFSGFLEFARGCSGAFQCSFEAPERQYLELVGKEAAVVVERAFTPSHADSSLLLRVADGSVETIEAPTGDPYLLMIEHFCDVVAGRAKPERPPAHSVGLAGLVDRLAASASGASHD